MTVLIALGMAVMQTTTIDTQISGNHSSAGEVFYAAEAGTEEARARLRATAGVNQINDTYPAETQWNAYIGSTTKTQEKGYDPGNNMHSRVDSLQTALEYTVKIQHATDGEGNILYWGDDDGDGISTRNTAGVGTNIYTITSEGVMGKAQKTIEIESALFPPLSATVPSPLYVEAPTTIQGTNTSILGMDGCGTDNKHALVSTQGSGSVNQIDNPTITGVGGTNDIVYYGPNIDIQAMVNAVKPSANFAYTVSSATHTGATTPGPGDNWGTPTLGATLQDPSSCSVSAIVHYDTDETYIRLSDGVSGCGLLLVEGDLELQGNFSWYGVILVTGSVVFTGGGSKQVTGSVLSGDSVDADVGGGNANIVYCSTAVANPTQNLPLLTLSWKEF
jgi:Tfp pilus assembly protein PilX